MSFSWLIIALGVITVLALIFAFIKKSKTAFLFGKIFLLIFLLGFGLQQACGCACSAPAFGVKSYIPGQSYPEIGSGSASSPFGFLPCPCACQIKYRLPLENLLIYLILIILLNALVKKSLYNY